MGTRRDPDIFQRATEQAERLADLRHRLGLSDAERSATAGQPARREHPNGHEPASTDDALPRSRTDALETPLHGRGGAVTPGGTDGLSLPRNGGESMPTRRTEDLAGATRAAADILGLLGELDQPLALSGGRGERPRAQAGSEMEEPSDPLGRWLLATVELLLSQIRDLEARNRALEDANARLAAAEEAAAALALVAFDMIQKAFAHDRRVWEPAALSDTLARRG